MYLSHCDGLLAALMTLVAKSEDMQSAERRVRACAQQVGGALSQSVPD